MSEAAEGCPSTRAEGPRSGHSEAAGVALEGRARSAKPERRTPAPTPRASERSERVSGGGGGSRSTPPSRFSNTLEKPILQTGEIRSKAGVQVQNRYSKIVGSAGPDRRTS